MKIDTLFLKANISNLAVLMPAVAWIVFSFASSPLMLPGLDIWIHLATIEFEGGRRDIWHNLWGFLFNTAGVEGPFSQAQFIHSTQLLIMGGLIFTAARWLLLLVFAGQGIPRSATNLASWLAVLVWMLMHGTQSSPINSGVPMWFGWGQWYSVNYQIALPIYVFSVSAILFALFGHYLPAEQPFQRSTYWIAAILGTLAVASLHAAELPYLLFLVLLIGIIWFKWAWRWHYFWAILVLLFVLVLGLEFSYRMPTGLVELSKGGPLGLLEKINTNGQNMVNGGNRGNASWNYWYWAAVAMSLATLAVLWQRPGHRAARGQQMRLLMLILASAIPAAMLHFKWTAGILTMITYPGLAWRFTFSSLLFLGPSLALLTIATIYPQMNRVWIQAGLAGAMVLGLLLASRQTETNLVSYQYARGVALSLSPEHMRFGLQPDQSKWLDQVHQQLIANPSKELVCTDMYTAYYLFFVKNYDQVVLPRRISRFIDRNRTEGECRFPKDGGNEVNGLGLGPVPWIF